jgi:tetratricopeptide (TPR) repeat protein
MITNTQDVKVTDFGLAKLWNLSSFSEVQLSDLHKDTTDEQFNTFGVYKNMNKKNIAGTPPWMAPEHFESVADSKSDIYSFGVVLFQMANHGKLPFIANSIEGFKEAHQKHPLPRFESSLFPIIKKCMEKSPRDRYLTFNDLRLALEDLYRKETGESIEVNIEIIEDDSGYYGNQGYSFLTLGLYEEAIQEFNKALTLEPNDIFTFNNLGLAYLNKGLFDKAIDAFKRAINLSPEYEAPYVNLVSAYMKKSLTINATSFKRKLFYSKIKNTLDKLLELNPNNAEGLQNLALYYAGVGNDKNKAVELLKRCIELNPDNPGPYDSLGIVYEQMGMIDKAFVTYKKAVQLNPMNESGLYSLGSLFLTQKMYEEAFPIFQRLTRINPVHEDGLCKLGGLYYKQQMHEEAFIIFQRLTRISPTNTEYQGVLEAIQYYISEFKNKKISKKEKKKKRREETKKQKIVKD